MDQTFEDNLLRIHRELSVKEEVTSLKLCTVHGIAVTSIDLEQVKAIQNIKTLVLKIDGQGSFVFFPVFCPAVVHSPRISLECIATHRTDMREFFKGGGGNVESVVFEKRRSRQKKNSISYPFLS